MSTQKQMYTELTSIGFTHDEAIAKIKASNNVTPLPNVTPIHEPRNGSKRRIVEQYLSQNPQPQYKFIAQAAGCDLTYVYIIQRQMKSKLSVPAPRQMKKRVRRVSHHLTFRNTPESIQNFIHDFCTARAKTSGTPVRDTLLEVKRKYGMSIGDHTVREILKSKGYKFTPGTYNASGKFIPKRPQ
jgi:hypothetical protein